MGLNSGSLGAQEGRNSQPRKGLFSARQGRAVEQGLRVRRSSLYGAKEGGTWALSPRAAPCSVQPPGASGGWFLEGDGGAVEGPGGGYSRRPLTTPAIVLITPPGQGQLQV